MTGADLKTERQAQGLTLRQVAPHLDMSFQRLDALERRGELTPSMAARLLWGLNRAAAQREIENDGGGNQLRQARDRQGLTLQQVADELGWHSKHLWYQERRKSVSPERTAAILQAIEQAAETREREARACGQSSSDL